ncbi:ABC-2 type transport system ATP-binding protein [Stackebrandtia albiflava]|uniref:ABC-2 type transport system ATP-binding protein n=1 Tax=Stackebrandtia albiflava TaxID=406432 RepID=A0A562VC47_9ACTN|nr:ATP-binding cassette domain-containing protein [Stackebrandtia albiflava]TWJ15454.1 ABC-2 type transport system ATP-binding protein [Stackebrandtia albiflava]
MTTHLHSPAVAATAVHKSYGDHVVLDGVDLDVPSGTVFALLGPNGAGKTTMVQLLSTLIRADSGQMRICGHDVDREPDAVRAAIGVTGQFAAVDGFLTGEENLMLMADLNRLPRRERWRCAVDLLERFELTDAAGMPAVTYSGGMRRRLDLAMTLVGKPRVVFLDEPTTGLDPRSRRTMWDVIRRLVTDEGVTMFLTTQYLEEADRLADRVAVLHRGRLVAEGPPEELKRQVGDGHVTLRFADPDEYDAAARILDVISRDESALTLKVPGRGDVGSLRRLLDRLDHAALTVDELRIHTPDLDDVFFVLTGDPTARQEPIR